MDALYFLVDAVLSFVVYAFLLRVLLQLVRADFRNPLAQAVIALTNWLVLPLRRVLPPMGRVDTGSLVALLAVQLLATWILYRFSPGPPRLGLFIEAARSLVIATLQLYAFLIFVHALLSLIAQGVRSPVTGLLAAVCEPVLRPLRRALPTVGGLDFSPFVAILLLLALRRLID